MIDDYEIKSTRDALSRANNAIASSLYDDYVTAVTALDDAARWLAEAVAEREAETQRADEAEEKLAALEDKLAEMTAERSA